MQNLNKKYKMKKSIITVTTVFLVSALFLTSCKKEEVKKDNETIAFKQAKAEGTISLNLEGEDILFDVESISLPYAHSCVKDGNDDECAIMVSGKSNEYHVTMDIRMKKPGNYVYNQTGADSIISFFILIARNDRDNPWDFVFGEILSGLESTNWNLSALNNFTLPDRDQATGDWLQNGKFDKLEAKFDAIDLKGRKIMGGNMNISYKLQ